MIPWIQVYSNLPKHPKTTRLADELKLSSAAVDPDTVAVGILVSLWTWAIQNAYDGDLSKCSPRSIAGACSWKKKPEELLRALTAAGWIDDGMKLHDWDEYAVLLMDAEDSKREKTRERVQRYRDKKRNADVTQDVTPSNGYAGVTCNADDTQVLRDVTPLHNITIHNHTIPGDNVDNNSFVLSLSRAPAHEEKPSAVEKPVENSESRARALADLESAQRARVAGYQKIAEKYGEAAKAAGAIFDDNFRFIAWEEDVT